MLSSIDERLNRRAVAAVAEAVANPAAAAAPPADSGFITALLFIVVVAAAAVVAVEALFDSEPNRCSWLPMPPPERNEDEDEGSPPPPPLVEDGKGAKRTARGAVDGPLPGVGSVANPDMMLVG